ncbi:hypothetical protein LWI29_026258 [Acer saccharum]|uniref:Uncharacterized protein n=1 Tax=Acer saccharum TaxID=4024 RepID=A0AA39SUC1_ACESA|nr:hypothetical protein LWI29_026258 [Acer saccharum]
MDKHIDCHKNLGGAAGYTAIFTVIFQQLMMHSKRATGEAKTQTLESYFQREDGVGKTSTASTAAEEEGARSEMKVSESGTATTKGGLASKTEGSESDGEGSKVDCTTDVAGRGRTRSGKGSTRLSDATTV